MCIEPLGKDWTKHDWQFIKKKKKSNLQIVFFYHCVYQQLILFGGGPQLNRLEHAFILLSPLLLHKEAPRTFREALQKVVKEMEAMDRQMHVNYQVIRREQRKVAAVI